MTLNTGDKVIVRQNQRFGPYRYAVSVVESATAKMVLLIDEPPGMYTRRFHRSHVAPWSAELEALITNMERDVKRLKSLTHNIEETARLAFEDTIEAQT